MKVTNRHGLPDIIARATQKVKDSYDRGKVDRSVTQLIMPPRIDLLRKANYRELSIDLSEELWSVLGSAVHHIMTIGANQNQIVEERLFASFDGWRLSGAIDLQEIYDDHIEISDYKVCATYQITMNDGDAKDEWVRQLNIYKWLVETVKGKPVTKLTIVPILRDWQRAQTGDLTYPQAPIIKVDVPVWTTERIEAYLHERINLHRTAEFMFEIGEELPDCTPEERWERGAKWAVKKKAEAKRAYRTVLTEADADALMATMEGKPVKEFRPGKSHRCDFCGVASWCSQYQRSGQFDQNGEHDELQELSGGDQGGEG